MTQGKQVGLSATEKIEILSRWKVGLNEIGRALNGRDTQPRNVRE